MSRERYTNLRYRTYFPDKICLAINTHSTTQELHVESTFECRFPHPQVTFYTESHSETYYIATTDYSVSNWTIAHKNVARSMGLKYVVRISLKNTSRLQVSNALSFLRKEGYQCTTIGIRVKDEMIDVIMNEYDEAEIAKIYLTI